MGRTQMKQGRLSVKNALPGLLVLILNNPQWDVETGIIVLVEHHGVWHVLLGTGKNLEICISGKNFKNHILLLMQYELKTGQILNVNQVY